jgi:hypothetical protein
LASIGVVNSREPISKIESDDALVQRHRPQSLLGDVQYRTPTIPDTNEKFYHHRRVVRCIFNGGEEFGENPEDQVNSDQDGCQK